MTGTADKKAEHKAAARERGRRVAGGVRYALKVEDGLDNWFTQMAVQIYIQKNNSREENYSKSHKTYQMTRKHQPPSVDHKVSQSVCDKCNM